MNQHQLQPRSQSPPVITAGRKRKEPPPSGSDSDVNRHTKSSPAKRRRGKNSRHSVNHVQNGDGDIAKSEFNVWQFGEKRSIPKADYNETTPHCPLPGCDSKGMKQVSYFSLTYQGSN